MTGTGVFGLDLPARCHVVLPGFPAGGNVFVAVRGRDGLEHTGLDLGDESAAREQVSAINACAGILPVQAHAMLIGAMRGWGDRRADPRYLVGHDRRFRFSVSGKQSISTNGLVSGPGSLIRQRQYTA